MKRQRLVHGLPVWKMSKAALIEEIDARLAAKGQSVIFPSRAVRMRYGRTELENECALLRLEDGT